MAHILAVPAFLAASLLAVTASALETILRIEADCFQNLDYKVEAFKTESRAVLGEYNENSANPIQKLIGALKLGLRPEAVTITPVAEVFSK